MPYYIISNSAALILSGNYCCVFIFWTNYTLVKWNGAACLCGCVVVSTDASQQVALWIYYIYIYKYISRGVIDMTFSSDVATTHQIHTCKGIKPQINKCMCNNDKWHREKVLNTGTKGRCKKAWKDITTAEIYQYLESNPDIYSKLILAGLVSNDGL